MCVHITVENNRQCGVLNHFRQLVPVCRLMRSLRYIPTQRALVHTAQTQRWSWASVPAVHCERLHARGLNHTHQIQSLLHCGQQTDLARDRFVQILHQRGKDLVGRTRSITSRNQNNRMHAGQIPREWSLDGSAMRNPCHRLRRTASGNPC